MWFEKWQTRIDTGMAYISAGTVIAVMFLVGADVIGRYLFNRPLPGAYELSEVMLATIIFLSLPYVQYKRENIAITMISDHYGPRTREYFELFCLLLGVIVFGFLATLGVSTTFSSWGISEISEGTLSFSITPFKSMIPLGFGFLSLRFLTQFVQGVRSTSHPRKVI